MGSHTDGPRSPGTVVQVTDGQRAWAYPTKAMVSDSNYAVVETAALDDNTHLLVATNFGHRIPPGARITEIKYEIQCKADAEGLVITVVRAWRDGAEVGINLEANDEFPLEEAYLSYSDANWGADPGWSPASIIASGFGYCLRAQNALGSGITGYVNHIRSTITYEFSGPLVRSRRGWVTKGYTR